MGFTSPSLGDGSSTGPTTLWINNSAMAALVCRSDVYSQWMWLWGNPQLDSIQVWRENIKKYQEQEIEGKEKEGIMKSTLQ